MQGVRLATHSGLQAAEDVVENLLSDLCFNSEMSGSDLSFLEGLSPRS